jgi:hypothetical protein
MSRIKKNFDSMVHTLYDIPAAGLFSMTPERYPTYILNFILRTREV